MLPCKSDQHYLQLDSRKDRQTSESEDASERCPDRMTSSLMRKYKSIEKIKAKIISHREKMDENEKRKSVSKQQKGGSTEIFPLKSSTRKENSLMLKNIVGFDLQVL